MKRLSHLAELMRPSFFLLLLCLRSVNARKGKIELIALKCYLIDCVSCMRVDASRWSDRYSRLHNMSVTNIRHMNEMLDADRDTYIKCDATSKVRRWPEKVKIIGDIRARVHIPNDP